MKYNDIFIISITTIVSMATTVQINEKTKEELLIVKAKLETQTGKKHSLDDAIQWLIENSKKPSVEERIKKSEEYFGSAKNLNVTLDDVSKARKEKHARIADF